MARQSGISTYQRTPSSTLDPNNPVYLAGELDRIEDSLRDLVLAAPQASTAPPKALRDAMVRLARYPWRPLGGADDRWVYYDAPTKTWKAMP